MPEEKTAAELAVEAVLRKLTPKDQKFHLWKFKQWEDQADRFEYLEMTYLDVEDELLHIKGVLYDTEIEEDEFGSWLTLVKIGREDNEPELPEKSIKTTFGDDAFSATRPEAPRQTTRTLEEIKQFWLSGAKPNSEKKEPPKQIFRFLSDEL
jgi:hypothetical protein